MSCVHFQKSQEVNISALGQWFLNALWRRHSCKPKTQDRPEFLSTQKGLYILCFITVKELFTSADIDSTGMFNKMYHNTSRAFIVELWSEPIICWLFLLTVIKSTSHLGLCCCTEYKRAKISLALSLQPQGFDRIDVVLIFSRTALLIQICLQ